VGREKNVAGVWKKMVKKGKGLGDVHDVRALRVVVASEQQCYATLAAVHARWPPLPNTSKDYIVRPKPNGY
jgi:(p)ppGpp synthase/HD superfamily hydrolase